MLSKPLAKLLAKDQKRWSLNAGKYQQRIFDQLVRTASVTVFGQDHKFSDIHSYADFQQAVPIRDYEELSPYVNQILAGKSDILWPGKPRYFAQTSGTTSGTKYIPITKDSVFNHINSARDALLSYVYESGNGKFLDGKLTFLSGSPELTQTAGISTGRLSGIVNHHIPKYLRTNQLPNYKTNCIEDWEEKVDKIVAETISQDMSLISGIPPWVQMYFDKLTEKSGKPIKDLFPNFSMFVYGGVNFEPYRAKLFETIGKEIPSIETYPTSEGFLAYQDTQTEEGLLLLSNSGIFFEFILADEYFKENQRRLTIDEVEIGVNYGVIISSNAGLWGYSIGDTIKFVCKNPHRILVTGRIKHFISAFGEHVIGEEVEKAMCLACEKFPETKLVEFTVAPQVNPAQGLPLHQWFVAFDSEPNNIAKFATELDNQLRSLNKYYNDLRGAVLKELDIISLKPDTFIKYMKSIGKLGGQHKVPRLANDRKIADDLMKL